ncbi:MAG: hypothetical protein LBT32_02445 [Peptococcaceae bacterium]|jgi:hypothetical protein|nr:hypothetical protein [Peptococcaceae bacterium]
MDERFDSILDACDVLTQYSAATRYPDESEVTELQTRKAFEFASAIKIFAPLAELRIAISENIESE